MYALSISSRKILTSYVFALTLNLIVLHWSSTFVGSIPWLILALGLSIFYLPLALVSKWGMSAYPLLYLLLEEVRNRFPFGGFGWVRIAYTQADAPYSKIAAIAGASALSALTLIVALFLFYISQKRYSLKILLPFLLILIPVNLSTTGYATVLMIQGDVPTYGLDFNSRAKAVFNNHLRKTVEELNKDSKVDFILWPENSVDVDPFQNSDVKAALDSIQQPLIIGAILNKEDKTLNASILWNKQQPDIYVKQHLTPFGEYIPLRWLARIVSPFVDDVEDFSAGDTAKTFLIGQSKVAPVICYELIDDDLIHNAAKNSNILAVQTNSATFGMSAESAQQLSITRIRAIEHGRNIASVSTTGYSAIINSSGKVELQTSMGSAASIRAEIGLTEGQTPRDIAGDWALVAVLSGLLVIARRAYR